MTNLIEEKKQKVINEIIDICENDNYKRELILLILQLTNEVRHQILKEVLDILEKNKYFSAATMLKKELEKNSSK